MPIDSNIALGVNPVQIESPMSSLMKAMQVKDAMQSSQMNAAKMDEYARTKDRQSNLYSLLGGLGADATDDQRINAMRGGGYFDEADKVEAGIGNRRKIDSEANVKDTETENKVIGLYRDLAGVAKDPATAAEYIKAMHTDPRLKNTAIARVPLESALGQIGQDPQSFNAWKQQFGLGANKFITENKPTQTVLNNGGANQVIQTPGLGGAPQTMMTAPITESANNVANNRRIATEGALNRDVQVRGQNMVDGRAREALTAKTEAPLKPLPTSALKMQQEALDAIGTASAINADLGAVEKQIDDKKVKFGPVSNLVNRGMNASGLSSEESRNFSSFQSSLERLRNESLRLNTGVQTDGDAQRAWNELFSNINDTDLVKQRLGEIKRINSRGVELQKLKIDSVRGNYGHSPLDTSGYSNQPAALNGGGASNINALLEKYK